MSNYGSSIEMIDQSHGDEAVITVMSKDSRLAPLPEKISDSRLVCLFGKMFSTTHRKYFMKISVSLLTI